MYEDSTSAIKIPPHDLDAEEAVLGSCLIDPEAIHKIVNDLKPEDFYREKNRWTYEAITELYKRNEPTNQILVGHELARRQRLEAAGGAAFLSHLVGQTPTSAHVEYYAKIVQCLSFDRKLISAANKIAAIGYEQPTDTKEALARAVTILTKLRDQTSTNVIGKGGISLNVHTNI